MNYFSCLFLAFLLQAVLLAQPAYVYTYVDYKNQDARIAIQQIDNAKNHDVGFLQSHLPIWAGNEVIFNGQNTIWKCDKEGENLRRISPGFRPSLSGDGSKYACYTGEGITVYDTAGHLIKILDVTPWIDITITWMPGDSALTFFNQDKEVCMIYYLNNDSMSAFGSQVFQPVWNRFGQCTFNKREENGRFQVYLGKGSRNLKISFDDRMSVVPVWSGSGKYIAYLSVKPDSVQPGNTDMFVSELVLYDVLNGSSEVLVKDAGFNDKIFPQMYFCDDDTNIYYTGVAANGNGTIKKVNIRTKESVVLKESPMMDFRFPVPNTATIGK